MLWCRLSNPSITDADRRSFRAAGHPKDTHDPMSATNTMTKTSLAMEVQDLRKHFPPDVEAVRG